MVGRASRLYLGWTAARLLGYDAVGMALARRRTVALVLLLWVFADLGMQGSCCQENQPSPVLANDFALASAQDGKESATPTANEGCICCCTHILPARHSELGDGTAISHEVPLRVVESPRGFNVSVYHPPRRLAA